MTASPRKPSDSHRGANHRLAFPAYARHPRFGVHQPGRNAFQAAGHPQGGRFREFPRCWSAAWTTGSWRRSWKAGRWGPSSCLSRSGFRRGKHWILHSLQPQGRLVVDRGAARALTQQGKSLLSIGITALEGKFHSGNPVQVMGPDGREIARGLSYYSSREVKAIRGCKSEEIRAQLGYSLLRRGDPPRQLGAGKMTCRSSWEKYDDDYRNLT